jgi:hypothetical protein
MTDWNPVASVAASPIDPATTWMLFVITMILHIITFHVLQYFADSFKTYLTLSAIDGILSETQEMVVKKHVQQYVAQSGTEIHAYNPTSLSRMPYQPLHETLDVSVFR